MSKMTSLKRLVLCAACVALSVVLPMAFHMIPNAGGIFLPMHIPVLLCGLMLGWPLGFVCGLVGPLLSSVLTGMPAMAILPGMMVELAVYGLVAGLLMKFVRTGKLFSDLYISLTGAMLVGRLVGGAARALIFMPGKYTVAGWAAASFVTGLPGIVIQLALIPAIYYALERARILPPRYSAR